MFFSNLFTFFYFLARNRWNVQKFFKRLSNFQRFWSLKEHFFVFVCWKISGIRNWIVLIRIYKSVIDNLNFQNYVFSKILIHDFFGESYLPSKNKRIRQDPDRQPQRYVWKLVRDRWAEGGRRLGAQTFFMSSKETLSEISSQNTSVKTSR